jgi:hypothetical protein
VSIFRADIDPVRGDAAALLGGATPFRGAVVGAGVGVVWAEAGPPRATSVRPNRKRELGVITRKKGKGEDADQELDGRSVNRWVGCTS